MKNVAKKEFFTLVISFITIGMIVSPVCIGAITTVNKKQISLLDEKIGYSEVNQGTEYWALLVGVGVYYNNPEQNRPSMLEAVDELYSTLTESSNWQADHIHTLKGSQATRWNLIRELIWLIKNEDSDDISLVYITTHGTPLRDNGKPVDLFPKDEADGEDEALIMYYGFDREEFFTDDLLNFFLNRLQSKGVCVIVDSCFAGGFNDHSALEVSTSATYTPSISVSNKNSDFLNIRNKVEQINNRINTEASLITSSINTGTTQVENSEPENNNEQSSVNTITKGHTAESFMNGFIEELAAQGRIVLMSCEEEGVSYNSYFSNYLTDGLQGWGDFFGNQDGINSAEEAFNFAEPLVIIITGGEQKPTILDLYPGELQVT